MAIIREHCQPGARRNPTGWLPQAAWPEDCVVQWGERGIVISNDRTRQTAFFEAFPTDPTTFIRGEGASIPEAEASAFAQFRRYLDCPEHLVERRGYRNGAGLCISCGLFISGAFEPLPDPDTSGLLGQALAGDPEALAKVMLDVFNHEVSE